jgi:putative transcriptional regulator
MNTKMQRKRVKTGRVLLAEPFMLDPNFRRAVVLLCEHQDEGSLGFIMNKPLKMQVGDLLADFPEIEAEVFFGGPVATDTIHYLHNVGELLEESVRINRGVYWGGNFEKLKFLINSELIQAHNIRFFVGYSGWSSGQLSEELSCGSWVLAEMHANYLFKSHPTALWSQIMYNKGDAYTVISQMPDSIVWN